MATTHKVIVLNPGVDFEPTSKTELFGMSELESNERLQKLFKRIEEDPRNSIAEIFMDEIDNGNVQSREVMIYAAQFVAKEYKAQRMKHMFKAMLNGEI